MIGLCGMRGGWRDSDVGYGARFGPVPDAGHVDPAGPAVHRRDGRVHRAAARGRVRRAASHWWCPSATTWASTGIYTVGIGILAYTFGLRHAFDADHIAAVDNTTRKLLADRAEGERRPLSVGFWFSLGHSTIVFLLAFLLSVGVKALAGQVEDDGSELHSITGIIGASVSGVFLWILGHRSTSSC